MNTGLFDKNGKAIRIGSRTRLVLDDGEVREFDVCFKTVQRTKVKTFEGFEPETTDVAITGVFFCWEGYDLLPYVDENGVSDTSKMEVIQEPEWRDIEKDLIQIEGAIKSQEEKENMFTVAVLQRCYKLVLELKRYRESGLSLEEIEGLNFSSNQLRLVNLLEEERKKHKLIPCSERLPNKDEYSKNDGRFIVTDGNRCYQSYYDIYNCNFKTVRHIEGNMCDFSIDSRIIAWMPLPQYKEG